MSSNGIYVYDIKHGTPKTYEEAHEILDTLSGFKESAPNPNMAAFGRNLMNGFLRQAWQFYEGDESLAECLGIENETARMLSAKYSFEFPPKQYPDSFSCAIIRAACENNLVVLHGDFECVFLPDGTALDARNQPFYWHDMVEENEQIWQTHIQELIAKQDKPQIPLSKTKRNSLTSKIVKERLGEKLTELFKKYGVNPRTNLDDVAIKTEYGYFNIFFITSKCKNTDTFELIYQFDIRITEEMYIDKMAQYVPKFIETPLMLIKFIEFYGLSCETNSHVETKIYSNEYSLSRYFIQEHEYDEWVKMIEVSADMLMYYLPHIGTVDDFIQFMQAHHAGETNFAELTLPDTNPEIRKAYY